MKEPTQDHQTYDFIDGRSANVSVYQSEKGTMVLVTNDAVNPFNHGEELTDYRAEIADKVTKSLNADPRDIQYVEQAGEHYQTVPLERSEQGDIQIPDNTRVMFEPAARVQETIREHESQQVNPELAQSPDWADHLQHPKDYSVDR